MKTDSIFYQIFQRIPAIFFQLVGEPPGLAESYTFRSVELKQTAFRIDGVMLPNAGNATTVYFTEVQFQPDPYLYHRFFAEIFLYLRQNPETIDWQGVLIYPTRQIRPSVTELHRILLDGHKVQEIFLDELDTLENLPLGLALLQFLIIPEPIAIDAARSLIARARQDNPTEISTQGFLELIETIIVYKFSTLTRAEIEAMFTLDELRSTRYFQDVAAEARSEELIIAIVGVLETRFEATATDLENNLRLITDITQLRQVLKKAVQASSLDEFQAWLTESL